MKELTGSQLGKEYVKGVYCHLAYLTYMQSEVKRSESRSVASDSLRSHHDAEHTMRKAGLDGPQAGIKTAARNNNPDVQVMPP